MTKDRKEYQTKLLNDWKAGNDAALSALFEEVYPNLLQKARALCWQEQVDEGLPETLVQDLYFLILRKKKRAFPNLVQFLKTASKIMADIWKDSRRKEARQQGREEIDKTSFQSQVVRTDKKNKETLREALVQSLGDRLDQLIRPKGGILSGIKASERFQNDIQHIVNNINWDNERMRPWQRFEDLLIKQFSLLISRIQKRIDLEFTRALPDDFEFASGTLGELMELKVYLNEIVRQFKEFLKNTYPFEKAKTHWRVFKYRIIAGFSQTQTGEKLGLSRDVVRRIEITNKGVLNDVIQNL